MLARLLSPLAPPLCTACGGWAGSAEPLCGGCRALLRWLPREPVFLGALALWAPLAYEGPARALVRALKFRGAIGLAGTMAAQMAANAPPGLLDPPGWEPRAAGAGAAVGPEPPALVPVPLHPSRRRRRGFNQAERLAAGLSARSGLPLADCLMRAGPPTTQVGRPRAAREAAVGGSIRLCQPPPRTALIVDDVCTTGSTLLGCAAALRAAGTHSLAALAYARTPGR